MKKKILTILSLISTFCITSQITDTQTWEVFRPGVKLVYDINACSGNNGDTEESSDDFIYCDDSDKVTVKSYGLTHSNILSTHLFESGGNSYMAFATEKGLSVYNKNSRTWKNIPIEFFTESGGSNFLDVIDVNGKLLFSGSDVRTKLYNPTTNNIEDIDNSAIREFKKSGADVWGYVYGNKALFSYINGVANVKYLNATTNWSINGFDIASDGKIYIAANGLGIVIYNPNDETQTTISPDNSELFSSDVQDVDFDNDGNLWIAIGDRNEGEKGQLVKWDITANTFTNYQRDAGNGNGGIDFKKVEVVNNDIWITSLSNDASDEGIFKLNFENETPVWKHFDGNFLKQYYTYFTTYDGTYIINNLTSNGDTLFISTVNSGVLEVKDDKWTHYNPLENNLPSGGNFGNTGNIMQNKNGGVAFVSHNSISNIEADIVSYFNNDTFTNYLLRDGEMSSWTDGRLDAEGNFFTIFRNFRMGNLPVNTLSSLNYPYLIENVSAEDLDVSSLGGVVRYSVEGINHWLYQQDTNDAILFNLDTRIAYKKSETNLDLGAVSGVSYMTEGRDERIWMVADKVRFYDVLTDTSGSLDIPNVTGKKHNTLGNIEKIVFGVNENEMWLVLQYGLLYLENETLKHTFNYTNSNVLSSPNDLVIDENNNAYAVSGQGLVKITGVQTENPTFTSFLGGDTSRNAGPYLYNISNIVIDNDGNKWLKLSQNNGTIRLIKFNEGTDPKGITNGANVSSLRGTVSGKIYIDNNDNNVFDSAVDAPAENQAIHLKYNDTNVTVYTNKSGEYRIPIYIANTEYELAISSTNGFAYTEQRNFKVNVTDLDGDYSNNNIPLKIDDLQSLYIKGSTKEGAWGFSERPGFENTFVTAVANLSKIKTFKDVQIRYSFINTNVLRPNYEQNSIEEIKVYKLKQNNNNLIIDKIKIYADAKQEWEVDLNSSEYTITEIPNIQFTETDDLNDKLIEFTVGDIAPYESLVVQIKTTTFDPVSLGDIIEYGITEIATSNWSEAKTTSSSVNDNWRDATSDSEDSRSGRHEDLSPYTEPDDVYQDEDDVFRDRNDVYSDSPYQTELFSSYDPNDKLVSPGVANGENKTDIAKKWLTYTIRFQNNGNFSAKDIYVIDTLDVDIDRNSFQFIESSHDIQISDIGGRDLSIKKFLFQDIYLIDSLTDPEGSQGYLKFKIKAKEDIAENTLVENTAHIYFDQNPAIVTNTVKNLFRTPPVASVKNFARREDLYVYPNPAQEYVRLSTTSGDIKSIEIYNYMGKKIQIEKTDGNLVMIKTQHFASGIYFLKVKINEKIISKKLIIN